MSGPVEPAAVSHGSPPVVLRVPGSGARAEILPARGCTCVSAVLEGPLGPRDVLWAPEGFVAGAGRPSAGGIPILCPFPGRLASTTVSFAGRDFTLAAGDGQGRPIHGLVHDRPWRVVQRSEDRLVARFRLAVDAPAALDTWPADFELTAAWTLSRARLDLELDLLPLGAMPAALGLHPYHPLPVVPGADPAACELELPATLWQPQERLLPVGEPRPVAGFGGSTGPRLAFPGRTRLGGMTLDDPFTGLIGDASAEGGVVARLVDPASGAGIEARWDAVFAACVLFTPPHRRAVCIEPCTVLPGQAGFPEQSGWKVLGAGEHLRARYSVSAV